MMEGGVPVPAKKPPLTAAPTIDRIARALCTSTCAYHGKPPCWSVHNLSEDAMEWPNPFCADPGCHSLATDVYLDVVPRRREL